MNLRPVFVQVRLESRSYFRDQLAIFQMTQEEVDVEFWHEIWSRVSAKLGIQYIREKEG